MWYRKPDQKCTFSKARNPMKLFVILGENSICDKIVAGMEYGWVYSGNSLI